MRVSRPSLTRRSHPRRVPRPLRVATPPVLAAVCAATLVLASHDRGGAQTTDRSAPATGSQLYQTACVQCHGPDLAGVTGFGPSLLVEGAASADYALRTGRMPLADPAVLPERGPVRYTDAEIRALVEFVASKGTGPAIPTVDAAAGDLVAGGELFRLNCAACHVASGAGAVIGGDRRAPSLATATATQIGEAIAVGPGAMPVLSSGLTDADVNSIAAYIGELQHEDTTGAGALGGVGPVAEGLAAWALGLLPLIAITRWIGGPRQARPAGARRGRSTTKGP